MEKKLSKEEIDLKIKKSIDKLSRYYVLYNFYSKQRKKVKKIDRYLRKHMWTFVILYTLLLILLLK